jgi:hypothetical protein
MRAVLRTPIKHPEESSVRSHACLACDVLDIQLPSNAASDIYTDADDWNLEGACHLPRNAGNSEEIMTNRLSYTERCTGDTCVVWHAYVGDSQLRYPYDHLINVLFGYDWPDGQRNVKNVANHHLDRRVCCYMHQRAEKQQIGQ